MIRLGDFEENEWAAGRSYLSMGCRQGANGSYRTGIFRHPVGLVEVYEQLGNHPMTSLRFRFNGRDYSRLWRAVWGDKTIARLARELVEDVV